MEKITPTMISNRFRQFCGICGLVLWTVLIPTIVACFLFWQLFIRRDQDAVMQGMSAFLAAYATGAIGVAGFYGGSVVQRKKRGYNALVGLEHLCVLYHAQLMLRQQLMEAVAQAWEKRNTAIMLAPPNLSVDRSITMDLNYLDLANEYLSLADQVERIINDMKNIADIQKHLMSLRHTTGITPELSHDLGKNVEQIRELLKHIPDALKETKTLWCKVRVLIKRDRPMELWGANKSYPRDMVELCKAEKSALEKELI